MRAMLTNVIEAPACTCDHVDSPGQEDDDTGDRGEPLIIRGWYVTGVDPAGLAVCGTVRL